MDPMGRGWLRRALAFGAVVASVSDVAVSGGVAVAIMPAKRGLTRVTERW